MSARSRRAAARARHPTARTWPPDRARLLRVLAERAAGRGARWPRVAAAVIALRGVAGDDRPTFAARVGIPLDRLERLEEGREPPAAVPPALRAVRGVVDWAWVDAGPPAGPPG